jgi:Protein of unknown function (DUF1116)
MLMDAFFGTPLAIINVGLASFAEAIEETGSEVLQLDWRPPGLGDIEAARILAKLVRHPSVESANEKAFARYRNSNPVLEGVGVAGKTLPGMGERMILHAGPPIEWERMCGPMRGAIAGAILLEGWAQNLDRAGDLAARGEIVLAPCHNYNSVAPMAGVISPSMPVWIVADHANGIYAYSNLNEGLGKVLRFGANSPEVLDRLKWIGSTLAPALSATVAAVGGIELKPLMAQALNMGDELHNRNNAGTLLLLRRLVPAALKTFKKHDDLAAVFEFITGNDHFFLNISMAACKAMMDAAAGIEASSIVTAMARNGVDFGLRVGGAGDTWFTAPAPMVDGLFFPGYSKNDAAPDLGDSSITETAGIGGFAMAAAPAIVQFVGGTARDAIARSKEMMNIVIGRNEVFALPGLDFAGTPAGIDVRKVIDTGITPVINTGIAHREAGIGQIGAGVTRAPMAAFTRAIKTLAAKIENADDADV